MGGLFSRKKKSESIDKSVSSWLGRLADEEYLFADDDEKERFARTVADTVAEAIGGRVKQVDDNTLRVSGRLLDRPVRVGLNVRDGSIMAEARTRRAKEFDDANLYLFLEHDAKGAPAAPEEPDPDWDEDDDRKVFFSEHMCIEYAAEDIEEKRALFETLPEDLRHAVLEYLDPRHGTFNFALGTVEIESGVQLLAYRIAPAEAVMMATLAARLAVAIDESW